MGQLFLYLFFSLTLLLFGNNTWALDENYECTAKVDNRSGTIDISRCRSSQSGKIACYEEITETCEDRANDIKRVFKRTFFTGQCTDSFADCW